MDWPTTLFTGHSQLVVCIVCGCVCCIYTLEDDPMDPENHWLVEENTLPGGQDVRVDASFRESKAQDH